MLAQTSLARLAAIHPRLACHSVLVRRVQTATGGTTSSGSASPSSSFPAPSSSSSSLPSRPTAQAIERLPTNLDYRNILRSCSHVFANETPLRSSVWRKRLKRAEDGLQSSQAKQTRIAVVGASISGTSELINCLFDEPLSDSSEQSSTFTDGEPLHDNEARMEALRARYENRAQYLHTPLRIRYGRHLGASTNLEEFTLPHSWLKDGELEVVEIVNPTTDFSTLDELYASDMILFVTDEATLSAHRRFPQNLKLDPTLQLLRYFASKPATRVLVNHVSLHPSGDQDCLAGLEAAMGTEAISNLERQTASSTALADRTSKGGSIMHASFSMAAQANDALRLALSQPVRGKGDDESDGQGAAAWTAFSSLYSASGMRQIKSTMERTPLNPAFGGTLASKEDEARLQTTNYLIRQSLDQALYGVFAEVDEVRQAQGAAVVLREEVEAYRAKTEGQIFSLTRRDPPVRMHERAGDRSKSEEGAIRDSNGFVEATFASRLPWWKILWKVDDVRAETEAAIDRSFAKDVEKQVMFETGKLINVADRLQQRTASVFKVLSPASPTSHRPLDSLERDDGTFRSAFHSPLLLNELRQHSMDRVESSLRADMLTLPIERRRSQLLAAGGPVDVLCLRAQRGVLTSVAMVGSSGAVAVAGALVGGPLGAALPAVLGPLAMQASTAGASFAFVSLFSVWLLQTRWTRAKRRFWRDWQRISSGLDADLKSNLDDVFENVIGAQAVKAATGLQRLANSRTIELDWLYERIEKATTEVQRVMKKSSPPA